MIKNASILFVTILILSSCQKAKETKSPFSIGKHNVGYLTDSTQIHQLDSIFTLDSIVNRATGDEFLNTTNEIEIYEKGGKKLLILEANRESDSKKTVKNIEIIDSRYKTSKGLSPASYFKDIKNNYTISKINNTLSAAVVFIDSINVYVTIDKKELAPEFKFNTDAKIKASQIPDSAKIKHFWVGW